MRSTLIVAFGLSAFAAAIEVRINSVAAQPSSTEFCGRDNGRFIASCPATCQAACNDTAFTIRSQAILNACRQVRDMTPAQRRDAADCARAARSGEYVPPPIAQTAPPVDIRPRPGPRPPPATAISRLGQGAETCVAQVGKSEAIEARISRIGNEELKKDVAAFWAGRPDCAPSSEALVDTFQCIQGGANEISQGYADIRRQITISGIENREDFCRVAKPLTEGTAYTELQQVDERVAKFDVRVVDLNECAKKFWAWSDQKSRPPQTAADRTAAPGTNLPDASASSTQLSVLGNNLSDQLQKNLQKFAGVQAEFIALRENIGAMKREVTGAVARAVNICP